MTSSGENRWTLFHSRLSFALNVKMLNPREVVAAALHAFSNDDRIDIAQIEGFVRQILGWREFIRGVYWANMPEYADTNFFAAQRPLPDFYWDGDTKMSCMKEAIGQSLDFAYAHHIQRLMITGTFGLLSGINPDDMDAWYLGIYIDAVEWVEMPNTRGMSQYADGGLVGSKPYAASGSYVNRMSDYCKSCHYQVSRKIEPDACPFNSLYWHFMDRHRERLERNPRIGMVYKNWDRQADETKLLTLKRAEWCLENLNSL